MNQRNDDPWLKQSPATQTALQRDHKTLKAINSGEDGDYDSGDATIAAGAPLEIDGWDDTVKMLKVKRPTSDSPEVTFINIAGACSTGEITDVQPAFGRVYRRKYDEAPDALLDNYGAGEDADTLIKGNTGFKLIADLEGGVGLFLPFKSGGSAIRSYNIQSGSSSYDHTVDSFASINTSDEKRLGALAQLSFIRDESTYEYTSQSDFYINLGNTETVTTDSSLSMRYSKKGEFAYARSFINTNPNESLTTAALWYIAAFDAEIDFDNLTDFATRPLGTTIAGLSNLNPAIDGGVLALSLRDRGGGFSGLQFSSNYVVGVSLSGIKAIRIFRSRDRLNEDYWQQGTVTPQGFLISDNRLLGSY